MSIDYGVIGRRLRERRLALGLTQEQTAEAADITAIYLSKIENGRVEPRLHTLAVLCTVLGLELGALFSGCQPERENYETEQALRYYTACAPAVKPIALSLLRELSKLG